MQCKKIRSINFQVVTWNYQLSDHDYLFIYLFIYPVEGLSLSLIKKERNSHVEREKVKKQSWQNTSRQL